MSARSWREGLLNDRLVSQMVTAFLNIHELLTEILKSRRTRLANVSKVDEIAHGG